MPFRLKPTPLALSEIHLITLYIFPSAHFIGGGFFFAQKSSYNTKSKVS